MESKSPSGSRVVFIVFFVLAALFASRFLMAFGRMFLVLAGLALLGYGVYLALGYVRDLREKKRHESSPEGVIESRMVYCASEIEKNREAVEGIRRIIAGLEEKLRLANQAGEENKQHTRTLVREFEAEMELREAKVHFLETCLRKLQIIQHNFELSKTLALKKAELQAMREQNFEEIAGLEELRTGIEYDRTYLETIDNLSSRMIGSQSLETVKALRKELEEMTRSLDEKK